MAIYQSIHTGLEIDEGITQVGVLTPIVTGNTEQINNINQALVTLDDTVTGNTEQISLRLKLDQTTPQTLTQSPKINDLVAGQMCYVDSNKQLKPIDVFWDNVNKRMGVGSAATQRSIEANSIRLILDAMNFGDIYSDLNGFIIEAGGNNYIEFRTKVPSYGFIMRSSSSLSYFANIGAANGYASFGYNNVIGTNSLIITALGNVGIKTTTPKSALQVAGGIQCGDDTAAASADKVGTTRYRATANASYVEMCMQVGANSYSWVAIVTNTW